MEKKLARFWRGSDSQIAASERVIDEQVGGEELVQNFMSENAEAIEYSRDNWNRAYSLTQSLKSSQIHDLVREGVDEYAHAHGDHVSDTEKSHITKRATESFATLCYITCLAHSKSGSAHFGLKSLRSVEDRLPQDAQYIFSRNGGPREIYAYTLLDIYTGIKDGTKSGDRVLNKLVGSLDQSDEFLPALEDLIMNGATSVDPKYNELQKIIATDWRREDTENSILRKWLSAKKDDPNSFIDGFIDKVVHDEADKNLRSIRNMARFAIAASTSGNIKDEQFVKNILQHTRNRWSEFKDIDEAYTNYKELELAKIEAALNNMAGPAASDNPRLPKSLDDVERYKSQIRFDMDSNRAERRQKKKFTRSSTVKVKEPNIDAGLEPDQRFDRANKPIMVAKNSAGNGLRSTPIEGNESLQDLVTQKVGSKLADDISRCIAKINEDPMSNASTLIKSGNGQIKIDGKTVRLRRFRPNHQSDLKVEASVNSYRIVYGIINGSIVLVDILDHDQFDRKYT